MEATQVPNVLDDHVQEAIVCILRIVKHKQHVWLKLLDRPNSAFWHVRANVDADLSDGGHVVVGK